MPRKPASVLYPKQQIYHITFGMNVINWHASTDNWAAAYRLLQNDMWASEDADQPAHHWSIFMAMSYLTPLEMYKITGQRDF